jgi:hypothetical protein
MQRNIGVCGIRIEGLTHGQHRLAMVFRTLADEMNFGRNREISCHPLPYETKSIRLSPHKLAPPR